MSFWFQKKVKLSSHKQGCYLITDQIMKAIGPHIKDVQVGLCNLLLQHTSAGLILCENYQTSVRNDMNKFFNKLVPEGKFYEHDSEGADDMPAHIKCALTGVSLNLPIKNGELALGTWQGVWLMEYRTSSHQREIIVTVQGQKNQ